MTHYTVLVAIPHTIKDIRRYLDDVMAPYDENTEVEPYVVETATELRQSRIEHIEAMMEKLDNPDKWDAERIRTLIPKIQAMTDEEYIKDYRGIEDDQLDSEGNLISRYNPNSKWDWYDIGGRWDGMLNNENQCKAKDFNKDWNIFAFVDLDGKWHENGRMGWWAMVLDKKEPDDVWDEKFHERFIQPLHPETQLILLDCHI